MSSELESVNLPAELLDEARDAARSGAVGSVADYVAEAVRLRLAKDHALAQVTRLFGGPPPDDILALVRQRGGPSTPPRHFVIGGRILDVTAIVGFSTGQSVYAEALVMTAIEENIVLTVPSTALVRACALIPRGHELGMDVLLGLPCTVVDPVDTTQARAVGALLQQGVHCAQRRGWPVVTGDPEPLLTLDNSIEIEISP